MTNVPAWCFLDTEEEMCRRKWKRVSSNYILGSLLSHGGRKRQLPEPALIQLQILPMRLEENRARQREAGKRREEGETCSLLDMAGGI